MHIKEVIKINTFRLYNIWLQDNQSKIIVLVFNVKTEITKQYENLKNAELKLSWLWRGY